MISIIRSILVGMVVLCCGRMTWHYPLYKEGVREWGSVKTSLIVVGMHIVCWVCLMGD
jgi:hypothetical protein